MVGSPRGSPPRRASSSWSTRCRHYRPFYFEASGPSADRLGQRAAQRDLVEAAPPPPRAGQAEAPPPLEALPQGDRRATTAMMANLAADATPAEPRTDGTAPADAGQVGVAIEIRIGRGVPGSSLRRARYDGHLRAARPGRRARRAVHRAVDAFVATCCSERSSWKKAGRCATPPSSPSRFRPTCG